MANNGGTRTVHAPEAMDLRKSREGRGLSLEEIADRTKISIRFLRAIEAGQFTELPGGIFAKSYLKQYAEAVGVDEALLLARYQSQCDIPGDGREPRRGNESATKPLLMRFWSAAAGR